MESKELRDWWNPNPIAGSFAASANQDRSHPTRLINNDKKQTSSQPNSVLTKVSDISNTQNWKILGRVYYKSNVAQSDTIRGSQQQFSVYILDASGIDICGLFTGTQLVQHFHDNIHVGCYYNISNANLQKASRGSTTGCTSIQELCFNMNSVFSPVLMSQPFNLIKLNCINSLQKTGCKADIIAIVTSIGDLMTATNSKGIETTHCNLKIIDDTNTETIITVWNENAIDATTRYAGNPVVSFLPVRMKLYNQELVAVGQVIVSPTDPASVELLAWWNSTKGDIFF
jgi:hypothetical protein